MLRTFVGRMYSCSDVAAAAAVVAALHGLFHVELVEQVRSITQFRLMRHGRSQMSSVCHERGVPRSSAMQWCCAWSGCLTQWRQEPYPRKTINVFRHAIRRTGRAQTIVHGLELLGTTPVLRVVISCAGS